MRRCLLVGVLPLVTMATVLFAGLWLQSWRDLETDQKALADAVSDHVAARLYAAEREFAAVAESVGRSSRTSATHLLSTFETHTELRKAFAVVFIADAQDRLLAVGLPATPRASQNDEFHADRSQLEVLHAARRKKGALWSEVHASVLGGHPVVSLAIPAGDGVLLGELSSTWLVDLLVRLPRAAETSAFVLDRRGNTVAHYPVWTRQEFSDLGSPDALREVPSRLSTMHELELGGRRYIGTLTEVPAFGWRVLVAQPYRSVLLPLFQMASTLAAGTLAAFLLATIIRWRLAGDVAARIGHYAEQARGIAEGNYDWSRPLSGIHEFDRLAADLEHMSQAISQRERALALSEERYRSVIGSAPMQIFQFDGRGVLSLSNGSGPSLLGSAAARAVGLSLFDICEQYPDICSFARRAIDGEAQRFMVPIGTRTFDISFSPMRDVNGAVQVLGVAIDVTERRLAELALQQANRRLHMLSECSQALVRAANETVLLETICRIVVDIGGYQAAHVDCTQDDERATSTLDARCHAAPTPLESTLSHGTCPPALQQTMFSAEEAVAQRQATGCILPLIVDDQPLGSLHVYSPAADAFDDEERALLRELADDLAFGIIVLRTRKERERAIAALRDSESLLRRSQEVGDLGSYCFDGPSRLWISSEKLDEILGIDASFPRTLAGWLSLVHPEDRAETARHVAEQVIARHRRFDLKYRIIRQADGRERWVHGLGEIEFGGQGSPLRLIGTIQDITHSRHTDQALQESEARYRLLFESNPHPMWAYDLQTLSFLAVNDAAIAKYGYSREEFLAMTVVDIMPKDDVPLLSEDVVDVEEGNAYSGMWRHVKKDGTFIDVEIVSHALSFQGHPAELALANDVTERRRYELALLQSELKYRELVENANSIILRWNPQGQIVFINEFGQRFFGYTEEELVGRHVVGTIVPGDESTGRDLRPLMDEICRYPERFELNINENVRRDGQRVWVSWTNKAILDANGTVREVFSVGSDITERKLAAEKLAESEARYFSLFETAPDAIVIVDWESQQVLNANRAACKLYGYTGEEFRQLPADEVPAQASRTIAGGDDNSVFARWERKKDGTIFLVDIEIGFFEQGGRRAGVIFIRDITERKRAEEALLFTQFAVDRSSDAAYWMGGDGRFTYVNRAACQALGYSRAQLLTMSVPDIDPTFSAERWRLHWQELRRNGHLSFESQHRAKDGAIFPVEVRANFIEFAGKEYNCALARDISERKRSEAALRDSEERFAKAFHASPAPMGITDIESGRFIDVNTRLQAMFGYVREEMIGRTSTELGFWADPGHRERMIQHLLAKGSFSEAPTRFVTRSGDIRDGLWSGEIIRLGQRDVLLSLAFDITERKRAENEILGYREHLEDLVAERTAELERANKELRQAMAQLVQAEKLAALGNLVAGVAHELNTPLGNSRVVASVLAEQMREFAAAIDSGTMRRSQLDGFLLKGREAVDLLERNIGRAADLISNFKQVAVDQSSTRRRTFDLRQTVEEMLVTLQPVLKRTQHRVELDIPSGLTMESYPGPLEQVFANLVNNSLVHAFSGIARGRMVLRVQDVDEKKVVLNYFDNGVGIPSTVLTRIFEPFFTTRLGQGGSGLGLYIVYNLVTGVLGGSIATTGEEAHRGAHFTLTLPRVAPVRTSTSQEALPGSSGLDD